MDTEAVHRALIAAIDGIAAGLDPKQTVKVPPYMTSVNILSALKDAIDLPGAFHAEHMERVDAAFERIGQKRASDQIADVARALLAPFLPAKKR